MRNRKKDGNNTTQAESKTIIPYIHAKSTAERKKQYNNLKIEVKSKTASAALLSSVNPVLNSPQNLQLRRIWRPELWMKWWKESRKALSSNLFSERHRWVCHLWIITCFAEHKLYTVCMTIIKCVMEKNPMSLCASHTVLTVGHQFQWFNKIHLFKIICYRNVLNISLFKQKKNWNIFTFQAVSEDENTWKVSDNTLFHNVFFSAVTHYCDFSGLPATYTYCDYYWNLKLRRFPISSVCETSSSVYVMTCLTSSYIAYKLYIRRVTVQSWQNSLLTIKIFDICRSRGLRTGNQLCWNYRGCW